MFTLIMIKSLTLDLEENLIMMMFMFITVGPDLMMKEEKEENSENIENDLNNCFIILKK